MVKRAAFAKISRPRLFGVMPRERLFALLDANLARPLVWISGPPGAGKTSLVASYLSERECSAVWYQVDSGDGDPASVFHYLSIAGEQAGVRGVAALPRFAPEHSDDLAAFARIFFRALFTQLPGRCVLVFDNCQEAAPDAPLHEILRQAAAEAPPDSSVVAISRADPPANFAPLTANGAMVTLGWTHLQLRLEEVRAIAAQRTITDDRLVGALHEQSQGWAAGITLMLERMAHATEDAGAPATETREAVFDYFASLLLDGATESTRQTLLSVAFLPYMTASMANILSGRADSGAVLDQLYRRHLFTDRRPGDEPVYQFHALLREFLQARVRMAGSNTHELMVRSAQVLQAHGDTEQAMDLYIAAARWALAVEAILQNAKTLLASGRRQTLERWIRSLPRTEAHAHPWLLYWLGMAQAQTEPGVAISTLRDALARFKASQDTEAQVLCLAALLNAAFLGFVALDAMDAWLDDLLGRLSIPVAFSSADAELRVWGVLCSALFWIRPWHPWTQRAPEQVEALLARGQDANLALAAASNALATATFSGKFECGDRILAATSHLVEAPGASPTQTAWWLCHAGWLRFFEARYDDALHLMCRAGRVVDSSGTHKSFLMGVFHRCAIEFRVLGWGAAGHTLSEMEAMLPDARYPMAEAMLLLLQARRAQFQGQHGAAADLAELTEEVTTRIGSRYQEMLFGLISAELLLDDGRSHRARALLARSRALIERSPALDCWRAALALVEALLAWTENDRQLAIATLKHALALSREGKRRYYLRHLECAMPPMFKLALQEGIEPGLVQDLIRMFRLKPPADAPDNWPWPVRIHTLGRFDVQVAGDPLEFSRKLPRKTLLLLKAIIAQGGKEVREQVLCDALWGDEEGDAARNAFGITLLRLRKLLGSNETILQRGGGVSLNPELCWVDARAFEARLSGGEVDASGALALYGGTFLPADEDEAWSVAARERLRGRFIHALSMRGAELEARGNDAGALECYLRGIDADPIVESFYLGLMRCYERLGKRTEAISAFRRLRHTLSVLLGAQPSDSAQRLFQSLLGRAPNQGAGEEAHGAGTVPQAKAQGGIVTALATRSRRAPR